MALFGRIDRHSRLVGRMAECLGVDAGEAIICNKLSPDQYRSAVLSCTSCDSVEACIDWQSAQSESAGATPGYCRNKGLLETLAGKMS